MLIHKEKNIAVIFGSKGSPLLISLQREAEQSYYQQLLKNIQPVLPATGLAIVHQTHGTQVHQIVTASSTIIEQPRMVEGDALVTAEPGICLGITTADCVPIALYDATIPLVAMVHAGWRGTIGGILTNTINTLQQLGAALPNIRIIFGPAARSCCYKVGPDVLAQVPAAHHISAVRTVNGETFLDLITLLSAEARTAGISPNALIVHCALCTICSPAFYSYRRDGEMGYRQLNVIMIK